MSGGLHFISAVLALQEEQQEAGALKKARQVKNARRQAEMQQQHHL